MNRERDPVVYVSYPGLVGHRADRASRYSGLVGAVDGLLGSCHVGRSTVSEWLAPRPAGSPPASPP